MIEVLKTKRYYNLKLGFITFYIFIYAFGFLIPHYPFHEWFYRFEFNLDWDLRMYNTFTRLISLILPSIYIFFFFKVSKIYGYDNLTILVLTLYFGCLNVILLLFAFLLLEKKNKKKHDLSKLLKRIPSLVILTVIIPKLLSGFNIFEERIIAYDDKYSIEIVNKYIRLFLGLGTLTIHILLGLFLWKKLKTSDKDYNKWAWAALLGGLLVLFYYLIVQMIRHEKNEFDEDKLDEALEEIKRTELN